jgi:rhodanese-related sulfurtransferase
MGAPGRRGRGKFYNSSFARSRRIASPTTLSFVLDNWYLFATALISGGLLLWPTLSGGMGGGRVSAADAVRMINRDKAVLIDISDPAEYAAGHAVGARSVPLATLETSRELPKNKALPLVVVCPNGARAPRAVALLKKLGFENTTVLAGGLAAWRAANLPTEKTA